MKDALRTYADSFEWAERPSSKRYCKLKADAPDWIDVQAIHAALDAGLPDDWLYEHVEYMAETLTEYDWEDGSDESDRVREAADGLVDIYTSELFDWLATAFGREMFDEACETLGEGRITDSAGVESMVATAQFLALERIADEILRQCREHAEEEV